MQRKLKIYNVDSFTRNGAGGSPTAVILDANNLSDEQMQLIANATGSSHTAFVIEPAQENEPVPVRFFTAHGEILNCGHGTIAVHYTRATIYNYENRRIIFQQAKEGFQQVEVIRQKNDLEIYLQQNKIHFSDVNSIVAESLLRSLSLNKNDLVVGLPVILASPGSNRFLVGVNNSDIVNNIQPDIKTLKQVCSENNSIGCFVYAIDKLEPVFEATARMFAPNIGVYEDIINGNSSGCLGAYLLRSKGGDSIKLLVNQGQKFGLPGMVSVKVKMLDENYETIIGGTAKIQNEIEFILD